MNKLVVIIFSLVITGCAQLGHKDFYSQVAPMKYPPTQNVMVFEYSNVDLDEIYDLLYSDFLIIGKSSFNGPYEDPEKVKYYAESIGSDIFVATSQFKETRTSFVNLSMPTMSTTYISGYNGSGSVYGSATTYGTQIITIPVRVNRYNQNGMYLKNINNVNPLWERTREQYKKTKENSLSGSWENETYQIDLIQSGDQMVGFIKKIINRDRSKSWKPGQLKMVFGVDSGVGVYLMGNKTPIPSNFSVNKFGHLKIKLLTNSYEFSFGRQP